MFKTLLAALLATSLTGCAGLPNFSFGSRDGQFHFSFNSSGATSYSESSATFDFGGMRNLLQGMRGLRRLR